MAKARSVEFFSQPLNPMLYHFGYDRVSAMESLDWRRGEIAELLAKRKSTKPHSIERSMIDSDLRWKRFARDQVKARLVEVNKHLHPTRRKLAYGIHGDVLKSSIDGSCIYWWADTAMFGVKLSRDGKRGTIRVNEPWYDSKPAEVARIVASQLRGNIARLGLDNWKVRKRGAVLSVRVV